MCPHKGCSPVSYWMLNYFLDTSCHSAHPFWAVMREAIWHPEVKTSKSPNTLNYWFLRNPCEVARQHRAAGTALADQTLCCQIEISLCSSLCAIIFRNLFFFCERIFASFVSIELMMLLFVQLQEHYTWGAPTWFPLLWLQMHAVLLV